MLKNPKTVNEYASLGRKVAAVTFLTGSFILALYYLTSYSGFIYISIFYMISFLIVNGVVFSILFSLLFQKNNDKKTIFFTLFLMLLNIPIGYFYIQLGFTIYELLNSH